MVGTWYLWSSQQRESYRDEIDIVALILGVKLLLWAFGCVAFHILAPTGTIGGLDQSLEIWNRWDAPRYLNIAQNGYLATSQWQGLNYFPMYPLLVRGVALVVKNYLASALLVSGIASVAAGLELYWLTLLDYPRETAFAAVVFMFIFPTSYFLQIGYTEATLLAFVLGTFLALRQERWTVAGLCAMGATLTHIQGCLVALPMAIEMGRATQRGAYHPIHWLISFALVGLGLGLWMVWNYRVTGDPLMFLHMQGHWGNRPASILNSVKNNIDISLHYDNYFAQIAGTQTLIFLGLAWGATIFSWFYLPWSYTAWMAAAGFVFTSQSWNIVFGREILCLFPMYILMARASRWRVLNVLMTVWSLWMMATFAGQFVAGHWAY